MLKLWFHILYFNYFFCPHSSHRTGKMEAVSELSNTELSNQLKSHGLPSGPITQTTRPLFERKLRKHLSGESNVQSDGDAKDGSDHVTDGNRGNSSSDAIVIPDVIEPCSDLAKGENDGDDSATQFYSIQLPAGGQGRKILRAYH